MAHDLPGAWPEHSNPFADYGDERRWAPLQDTYDFDIDQRYPAVDAAMDAPDTVPDTEPPQDWLSHEELVARGLIPGGEHPELAVSQLNHQLAPV